MNIKSKITIGLLTGLVLGSLPLGQPARAASGGGLQQREYIVIQSDSDFTRENGVRSGKGTKRNPYVISGWDLEWAVVRDTDAWFTWRNTRVEGQLILNWNGDRVRLIDNYVGDLRTNQNVDRTGDMTSGLFKNNHFKVVGQLRHFDGRFVNNVVGTKPDAGMPYSEEKVARFDGFNGAQFNNNVFYGYADAGLHGHHHGSGFKGHSHHHDGSMHDGHMDHTNRYHEISVSNNTVYTSGPWGLRFNDVDHDANDRASASETEPELNLPHVHHTRVRMVGNKLYGAGMGVEVFNAKDELHKQIGTGRVTLANNKIVLGPNAQVPQGITVHMAQGLNLNVVDNEMSISESVLGSIGVRLYEFNKAEVRVTGNWISGFGTGIEAAGFNKSVYWWLAGNRISGEKVKVNDTDMVVHAPR